MGRELFEAGGGFRSWIDRLDRIAQRVTGRSVAARLYDHARRAGEPFTDLMESSLALSMVELALAHTLLAAGVQPSALLTASLGMFAGLVIGGGLDDEEALEAVAQQADAVRAACEPGGMIAVLAPTSLYHDTKLSDQCELAAAYGPAHFVIAGASDHLSAAEAFLARRDVSFLRLPVEYAFHSRWMDGAQLALTNILADAADRIPHIPVASCRHGGQLMAIAGDEAWKVARAPIEVANTFAELEARGPHVYIDVGPFGSFAALLRSALPPTSRSRVIDILTPFKNAEHNLQRALGEHLCLG
jgi:acyl transferase domain-containing protein